MAINSRHSVVKRGFCVMFYDEPLTNSIPNARLRIAKMRFRPSGCGFFSGLALHLIGETPNAINLANRPRPLEQK